MRRPPAGRGPQLENADALAHVAVLGFALFTFLLAAGVLLAIELRRRQLAWTWALCTLVPMPIWAIAVGAGFLGAAAAVQTFAPFLALSLGAIGWGLRERLEDLRAGGDREAAAKRRRGLLDAARRRRAERPTKSAAAVRDGLPVGRTRREALASIGRGTPDSGCHVLIPGATGAGKTTSLASLLVEYVIRSGFGAVVLEAKADRVLLSSAEAAAAARGAAFRLLSPQGPASYDPLAHGSVDERSERLLAVESWGSADADFYRQAASPFLRLVLRVLDRGARRPSLVKVAAACEPDLLQNLAASIEDDALRGEVSLTLEALGADQLRAIAGLRARLQNLASSDFARAWLDPERPSAETLDLRETIERREVAYLRFDTDRTGNVGRAIAQMALLDLGAAASARMGEGVGTFVAIDEFGALEAPALDRLFARGRAAGFSVALGTQTLADLRAAGPTVRERIGATVSAIICHRIGEQADAEWVAGLIGAVPAWQSTIRTDGWALPTGEGTRTRGYRFQVNPSELQRLEPGEAFIARLDLDGEARARCARVVPPGRRLAALAYPDRSEPAQAQTTNRRGPRPDKERTQMNVVVLTGNLTKDPELRGEDESRVCQMRLAVNGAGKDAPLYIDVAAFGRQGESCAQYLARGRAVAVSGRLRFREWKGRDGAKHAEHSLIAERVDFLDSAPRTSEADHPAPASA
jgi:single-strand DNA-binding protein